MPKKDEHINWATHDQNFWASIDLDNTPFTDWAVTGMFYESVHWVEAFLATKSRHSKAHAERKMNIVSHKAELQPIWKDYIQLERDSRNARYLCYQYTAEQVRRDLIPRVDHIKDHISQLL